MSISTIRLFYRLNNIGPDILFKEHYNFVHKVIIPNEEDAIYLNGYVDEIPENSKENIKKVELFRQNYPNRITEFSDKHVLYCIHP